MSASLPLPGASRKACGQTIRVRCDAATEYRDPRCTRLRSRRRPRARFPSAAAGSSSISARWPGRRSRGSASGAGSTPRTPIRQRRASAIHVHVLQPGESHGYYHAEAAQEGFLVLSGECVAVIENEERRMRQWDYFHSPPGTAHHGRRRRRAVRDPDVRQPRPQPQHRLDRQRDRGQARCERRADDRLRHRGLRRATRARTRTSTGPIRWPAPAVKTTSTAPLALACCACPVRPERLTSRAQTALPQGAPSWIRTSGLLLRRESLYPAELSGHVLSTPHPS